MTLRTILRDDQGFSAHLTEDLSVPAPVVQSLMEARVTLGPVSIRPLNLPIPSAPGQRVAFSEHERFQMLERCHNFPWESPRSESTLTCIYLTEKVA